MSLQVLWLARTVPFPITSGDRVYSVGLLKGLTRFADITYIGMGDEGSLHVARQAIPDVRWISVGGPLRSAPLALLSHRPYVSAKHSPPAMVAAALAELQGRAFDCVVLDQYGLGWAIEEFGDVFTAKGCAVVYLSHNYEAELAAATARDFRGNPLKRFFLQWNAHKIARMERSLLANADVVTAISEEDASVLARLAPGSQPIVLRAGADFRGEQGSRLSADAPRRLVMVGSFHWVPKQMNLIRFLEGADRVARTSDVHLDIIGEIPSDLRDRLSGQYRWVNFLGFVENLDALPTSYRLALNIEETGGGFKLKNLTYVAAGLPIAALSASLTGVPRELKDLMIVRDHPAELLAAAVAAMDDIEDLKRRADAAIACVTTLYDWDRTAEVFAAALRQAVGRRNPSPVVAA